MPRERKVPATVTHCGQTCLRRVYRGFVAYGRPLREITLFVEAESEERARTMMTAIRDFLAATLALTDDGEPQLYNVFSAAEMFEHGESADPVLRLFECGWGKHGITWVPQPIFLVRDPAALMRKYQQIPEEARHAA